MVASSRCPTENKPLSISCEIFISMPANTTKGTVGLLKGVFNHSWYRPTGACSTVLDFFAGNAGVKYCDQ